MHVAAKFSEEVGCSCFLSTFTLVNHRFEFDFRRLRTFDLDRQFALSTSQLLARQKLLKISPSKVSRIPRAIRFYAFGWITSRSWPNFFFFRTNHGTQNATRFGRRVEAERLALLLEIHGNHVCRCDPKIQLLVVSSPPAATRESSSREHSRPSFELSSKIIKFATRCGNNCKRHARKDLETDKCFPLGDCAKISWIIY